MTDLEYRILKLLYNMEKPLKVGTIAKRLNTPHSTIGSAIDRMRNKELILYEPYHDVELKEKGRDLAKELLRHQQLLEVFLYNELGLSSEEAHKESKKFNLLFSCEVINKICEKYNHPKTCPCGEKIISSQKCYCLKKN
ncbi:MAG: Diphtheria toxin repressor [Promethearchaeota archaeon]|nr:MAG: Diphtheria toxin repressor [Candidatus Lokiarchaeota archaeon]